VASLVAAWPGATEDRAASTVQAETLDGVIYGWQADWSAGQSDTDGGPVWIDFAREWFDSGAHGSASRARARRKRRTTNRAPLHGQSPVAQAPEPAGW
jgi:hypothetical protein